MNIILMDPIFSENRVIPNFTKSRKYLKAMISLRYVIVVYSLVINLLDRKSQADNNVVV